MTAWMSENFHDRLVREVFDRSLTEEDGLRLFGLLHSHKIILRDPVLLDAPGVRELAAVTRRRVASVVAGLWQGISDPRGNYTYWYFLWSSERLDERLRDGSDRIHEMKRALERHELVARIELDDD